MTFGQTARQGKLFFALKIGIWVEALTALPGPKVTHFA
jgi:hypothetical protein